MLALGTVGRRSGATRSTVVAYLRHGDAYAVGGLNLGSERDPAWCLNLRSEPRAWIDVGGERKPVVAREATGEEARTLWAGFIERLPATASSLALARARRNVPVFVLDPISR